MTLSVSRTITLIGGALVCLACGGLGPSAAGDALADLEVPVAAPEGPKPLSGKWCRQDGPACYLFDGEKVMEDMGGPKWQVWATFAVEGDMLVVTWTDPHEVWTWQIVTRTDSVLALTDLSRNERFAMVSVDEFPPFSARPK